MFKEIITVGTQVVILFTLIGIGYICGKSRMFTETAVESLTAFMLMIVGPSAIIDSFCRTFDAQLLHGLVVVVIASLAAHAIGAALALTLVRAPDPSVRCVLRFGAIFGNCGYMGLPLLNALLGSIGMFYGAAYIIVFTAVAWTYGLVLMSGDRREISLRRLAVNPGLIGTAIGLVIFLCSVKLPNIVYQPIHYLAALNTPVPMVIVGFYLSRADLKSIWKKEVNYVGAFVRLVATPLLLLAALYLFGLRGELLVSAVASTAVPTAALTTMLSVRYKQDSEASAAIVSMTTLLCLITMPLIVGLAKFLG